MVHLLTGWDFADKPMRALIILVTTCLCYTCFGQVFTGLGSVGTSGGSVPLALSDDGSTVVGRTTGFATAWKWTLGTGIVAFTDAPSGRVLDAASGVSSDGSTIVGSMNDGNLTYAWRWTQSSGIVQVPGVGGGATFGPFVSADGSTIVGTGVGLSIGPAVRWTQMTGAQSLNPVTGLPFGDGSAVIAYGVSGNGAVVVGGARAFSSLSPQIVSAVPFRWTESTGSTGILDNGQFFGAPGGVGATDVSADGLVMVGIGQLGIFRWSVASGFQLLFNEAQPPGSGRPHVSGDGLTVLYGQRIWTLADGLQTLQTVLSDAGCNFSGWTSLLVTDVSFNGLTLCGFGTNPTGQTEAWYATIPAPTSVALISMAGLSLMCKRRRQGPDAWHQSRRD